MEAVHKGSPMEDTVALTCQMLLEGEKKHTIRMCPKHHDCQYQPLWSESAVVAPTAIIKITVLIAITFVPPDLLTHKWQGGW